MNNREIAELFFEHDMRCEEMHPLFMTPLTALTGRLADVILEHDFDETLDAMGIAVEGRDDIQTRDDLEEMLYEANLQGFLAKFAKPIAMPFGTNDGYSSSWGYYRMHWIYADSIPELAEKAVKWAEEVFDGDMNQ